jgi:hypothetical protein
MGTAQCAEWFLRDESVLWTKKSRIALTPGFACSLAGASALDAPAARL